MQNTVKQCKTLQNIAKDKNFNFNSNQTCCFQFTSFLPGISFPFLCYFFHRNLATKHCKTLQNIAKHCKTFQNIAKHCKTLQNIAKHCKTLQNDAKHCKTMQNIAKRCKTLQNIAKHCKRQKLQFQLEPNLLFPILLLPSTWHQFSS